MIYVLFFMPDVYSLPFLRNQDAREVPGGQEGSRVRGHIYVLSRNIFVFQDLFSREGSSYTACVPSV